MGKCIKCNGKGFIKKKHFTVLHWPIFELLGFFGLIKVTEKRPGFVQEVKTCSRCKGTSIV